jgi:hypothetical protein
MHPQVISSLMLRITARQAMCGHHPRPRHRPTPITLRHPIKLVLLPCRTICLMVQYPRNILPSTSPALPCRCPRLRSLRRMLPTSQILISSASHHRLRRLRLLGVNTFKLCHKPLLSTLMSVPTLPAALKVLCLLCVPLPMVLRARLWRRSLVSNVRRALAPRGARTPRAVLTAHSHGIAFPLFSMLTQQLLGNTTAAAAAAAPMVQLQNRVV